MRGEYPARRKAGRITRELPPRARRIHCAPDKLYMLVGTTSACAENTLFWRGMRAGSGNYLRVRGEYCPLKRTHRPQLELPPRARRIHAFDFAFPKVLGTTSACAENTRRVLHHITSHRNYLRVRGEYNGVATPVYPHMELPPRARRIRATPRGHHRRMGTTSACAENT